MRCGVMQSVGCDTAQYVGGSGGGVMRDVVSGGM